jgi:hypothetical protein
MRLPLINIPVVYHLGTLERKRRGEHHKRSHEGAGLSVSLCPRAWEEIARLGGEPLKALCRHDALYLDLLALEEPDRGAIIRWAAGQGLVEPRQMWRAWIVDGDADEWRYCLCASAEDAAAEVLSAAGVDVGGEGVLAAVEEAAPLIFARVGIAPPGAELVEAVSVTMLTASGNRRARGFGRDCDAADMAAMFWVEDVLRKSVPSAVGVWWREGYDPDALSAPRGAVIPSCVRMLKAVDTDGVDDDDDLLDAMPETRLVGPGDIRSPYGYVTCCVQSSAELISPMVDSLASVEMPFADFARELGGSVREGRRILDEAFPDYRASGMDMAKDWHVTYHASQFDGMPCLYVVHSAIEYVFQRHGMQTAPAVGNGRDLPDGPGGDAADGMESRAFR